MPKQQNTRNFHACHPIMKKGGVHEKSKGAKRAAAKHDTRRKTNEWLGRSTFWAFKKSRGEPRLFHDMDYAM